MNKCCLDPACSHAIVAAAHQEAAKLTDKERQIILGVLRRNEQIQREQQQRVLRLKAELQSLRRKGAIKATSTDFDSTVPDPDRSCGRCRVELGRVINRGAYCRACRLKVCKGCREYSLRTTDWVCTVCHKHMEIQAASGEWMNEFVRRPSRRRDNRVYVPAADIIIRTLRRSWTISNPTPRWNNLREAPEMRPYSSLPRGQDISSYPSLIAHQKTENSNQDSNQDDSKKHSPAKRSHSEDVYSDRNVIDDVKESKIESPPVRVNPLIKFAERRQSEKLTKKKFLKIQTDKKDDEIISGENVEQNEINKETKNEKIPNENNIIANQRELIEKNVNEKRVSFDDHFQRKLLENKEKTVNDKNNLNIPEDNDLDANSNKENKDEAVPVELCDIEPLSGTVFRKVTVRRRRQDMRKMQAIDNGWRRPDADLLDILLPEGDDYKLVFISSDSSSKEEDVDDNDSSSASSFPIDDCDWDYFEPGVSTSRVLSWNSPFGSPSVYRRDLESPIESPLVCRRSSATTTDDERRIDSESPSSDYKNEKIETEEEMSVMGDVSSLQCINSCKSCGCTQTQFVPFPVPVPIPVPIPTLFPQESLVFFKENYDNLLKSRMRCPRSILPIFNQAALIWPLINDVDNTQLLSALLQTEFANQASETPTSNSTGEPTERNEHVECTSERPSVNNETTPNEEKNEEEMNPENFGYLLSECNFVSSSDDSDDDKPVVKSYNVTISDDYKSSDDDALPSSEVSDSSKEPSSSGSSSETDSDDTGTVADRKTKFSCVYVVNQEDNEDDANKNDSDDEDNNDYDNEDNNDDSDGIILKTVKKLSESRESLREYNSPRLSDVSAESSFSSSSDGDDDKDCDNTERTDELEVVGNETQQSSEWSGETLSEGKHAARYTSLVMITQEPSVYPQVSVVTSDTTKIVNESDEVIVQHTNSQLPREDDFFNSVQCLNNENVTVITGADTLSAVVCLEEGLADDDSWVENLSHDEDFDESSSSEETNMCTDQEDVLRGYRRTAINFTLHTIVEESCEESDVEQTPKKRPISATDLEKYFYYGLGNGNINRHQAEDAFSETSSICSESPESTTSGVGKATSNETDPADLVSSRLEKYFLSGLMGFKEHDKTPPNEINDPVDLASSRLEQYFLSGFMTFKERRDSDGSVGSDSEGKPSPEQRRKRLVRARGTGRSHSSSLDNLLVNPESGNEQPQKESENSEDSDSDTYDENSFEKSDGQFDTVKRKKKKLKTEDNKSTKPEEIIEEPLDTEPQEENDDRRARLQQQQRDSGFVGSFDDLIKDPNTESNNKENIHKQEKPKFEFSRPPVTNLTRKDSFNNWSSDEETNLMMCKMRQFFKTMVNQNSKPTTPINSPKIVGNSPRMKKSKPPQLVYFENELTRLMKTVPGIRDDQVREIVEYLSSEDTWSDSYDSSDYTSSDLEGSSKSALQQQISDSCQEIINKFDKSTEDEEGDEGDGGIDNQGLSKETAFVYQKLVASIEKIAAGDDINEKTSNPHNSPPLIAKVMHHIGKRLVALMHEVSSGESHCSGVSPKTRYHKRINNINKLHSSEDDDSTSDSNIDKLSTLEEVSYHNNLLPRSRSHDLLLSESRMHQSNSGVSDITEERETSDCERFSWRGSFESALLATDSRNKLSSIGEHSNSASALAIAAKRRSAGDLLFSHKSLSREQLDRVRSCGSIGGGNSEDKLWVTKPSSSSKRRSSVPDTTCGSGDSGDEEDNEDEEDQLENRSTLPRSLQNGPATTNSLPRLPTNNTTTNSLTVPKGHMYHFLQHNVKSARYRPPGFNRITVPKRAVSAPGLQLTQQQRRGRRFQQAVVNTDDSSISEAHSSPMLASRGGIKSASQSPIAPSSRRTTGSVSSQEWRSNEDDIDKLVTVHHNRSSLSSLGLRSDSMASVYSGAGEGRYGTVAVKGQVEFGLQYNYKTSALEIMVKQCRDLAAIDMKRNRSDPYVKVYLLPDKSKSGKRKTKVKKHTLNPVFDECLKFHITLNGLETRTLWLTVWHSDMFGRNDFLGEVMMALENKVFDDPTPKWYNLQERTEPFDDMLSFKGDILVGLKFVPPDMTIVKKGKRSRGALHVLVKEAKSLTAIKANGTSDPFCKSYLLPDKGRSSKQKTSVIKKTVNPTWNHTFVYDDVTLQELAERCLELTVWDHDRLASNEFLGGVRFSLGTGKHYGKTVDWMDATGKEISLWKNMLERPNFWVEGCLSLRPSLDNRTSQ
ncbi:uncharacterized protein [Onthophagus taurus]|uniref:uncharacterized protein isoform X2 n=1 Tax=Onthophagus taurus TaxID=166361 RepID=UPI0039BE231F